LVVPARHQDDAVLPRFRRLATPPRAKADARGKKGNQHAQDHDVALGAATCCSRFRSGFPGQGRGTQGGEITIDDGHFGDYADHLAGLYRKSVEFQKSKGWIKASYILANVNKRAGEPDLYLVTIADRPTTPAEDEQRAKETNAYLQSSARQGDAQSGARAKYRHLGGSMLLQEQVYRK
jgi:hypothetical protein